MSKVLIDRMLLDRIESAFNSGLTIPSNTQLRTALRAAIAAPVQEQSAQPAKPVEREESLSDLEACVRKFALEREDLLVEVKRLKAQPELSEEQVMAALHESGCIGLARMSHISSDDDDVPSLCAMNFARAVLAAANAKERT